MYWDYVKQWYLILPKKRREKSHAASRERLVYLLTHSSLPTAGAAATRNPRYPLRYEPNVLMLHYADAKKDLKGTSAATTLYAFL